MQGFSVFHLPLGSAWGQAGKPSLVSNVSSLPVSLAMAQDHHSLIPRC